MKYYFGDFCQTETKLFIFTRYQSIKIDIILRRHLNLVRVSMQTLSVKLLSCKILKMKNCVPFEEQYYNNSNLHRHHFLR